MRISIAMVLLVTFVGVLAACRGQEAIPLEISIPTPPPTPPTSTSTPVPSPSPTPIPTPLPIFTHTPTLTPPTPTPILLTEDEYWEAIEQLNGEMDHLDAFGAVFNPWYNNCIDPTNTDSPTVTKSLNTHQNSLMLRMNLAGVEAEDTRRIRYEFMESVGATIDEETGDWLVLTTPSANNQEIWTKELTLYEKEVSASQAYGRALLTFAGSLGCSWPYELRP